MKAELAEPGWRRAKLQADLAEAQRTKAAWRQLLEKSARVFATFSRRMSDALEANPHSSIPGHGTRHGS
jgi:hypothetical protein